MIPDVTSAAGTESRRPTAPTVGPATISPIEWLCPCIESTVARTFGSVCRTTHTVSVGSMTLRPMRTTQYAMTATTRTSASPNTAHPAATRTVINNDVVARARSLFALDEPTGDPERGDRERGRDAADDREPVQTVDPAEGRQPVVLVEVDLPQPVETFARGAHEEEGREDQRAGSGCGGSLGPRRATSW